MRKKIIGIGFLLIVIFGLTGCMSDSVADPFTQEQIITYLEEKYEEEFVFVKKEFDSKNGIFSRFVYSCSPKGNSNLSFYVADQTKQSDQIKKWDRALKDTYSHSLLNEDFLIIAELCDSLIFKMPSFEDLISSVYYKYDNNYLLLDISNDYKTEDITPLAHQLLAVVEHIKANFDKYKLSQDLIHIKNYSDNRIVKQIVEYKVMISLFFENGTVEWILSNETERDFTAIVEILREALNH